ncbi:MAG: sulfite exporter TauE/SafE family protein [Bacteroidetes bacterium]|nr:sulfite exporter TauE/SafE family protein [Bacteroidota bacterium]
MEYIIIATVACIASLLTLFSGFGVATLLTPAFILFFPVEVAVPLTSIVHLLNNIFKLGLLWKNINFKTAIRFGSTALIGAFIGAKSLFYLAGVEPIFTYEFLSTVHEITVIKVVIALLLISFSLIEVLPFGDKMVFSRKYLLPGGIISGFFGGLSGHQGALRSAFLIRCNLSKESFIATGTLIACFVDVSRIPVYLSFLLKSDIIENNYPLLIVATLAAFTGAYTGNKLLKKITLKTIQVIVSVMVIATGLLLGGGVL